MPSFLEKDIGPFSGGVWLLIIAGGAGLAFVIKRSMGSGGSSETKTEPLLAIETQTAPRVFGDVGQYGGSGGSSDSGEAGTPLVNPPSPKPVVPPMQPEPHKGPPGGIPGYPGPRPRQPAPPPSPTPAPAPKTPAPKPVPPPKNVPAPKTPAPDNIPGGYPADCQGVIAFLTDYPSTSAEMLTELHKSKNPAQRAGMYLGWTIGGVGSAPIPTKLQAANTYVANRANWATINRIRRTRRLRAMTSAEFAEMSAQIAAQATSHRDAFPDTFLAAMWDRWYTPFICRNSPRRLGAKNA